MFTDGVSQISRPTARINPHVESRLRPTVRFLLKHFLGNFSQ